MAQGITVAKFRDVAGGLQEGQFAVGDRVKIKGLSDLDPIYKALLDRPITVTLGLIGPDGQDRPDADVVRLRGRQGAGQHRLAPRQVRLDPQEPASSPS